MVGLGHRRGGFLFRRPRCLHDGLYRWRPGHDLDADAIMEGFNINGRVKRRLLLNASEAF